MRKIICILLLMLITVGTFAQKFTVGGISYQVTSATTVAVVANNQQYTGTVVIPATTTIYETNYNVTSIGSYAFSGCSSLNSVTIPSSVVSIQSNAFESCSSLASITIPNSVVSIGDNAFNGCTRLASLSIPNSVTSVGKYAFEGCNSLTSITIPASLASIGYCAFSCSGLINVDPNNSAYSSIDGVLYNKTKTALIQCPTSKTFVTIPSSVTTIGYRAFCNCTGLTSIIIPESVSLIEGSAFYNTAWYNNQPNGLVYAGKVAYKYKGIMSVGTSIALQNGTVSIAESAFSGSGLTSVIIPESVTSIGVCAFTGCINLASITLPKSLMTIGQSAFELCGLKSITIPSSLDSIPIGVFRRCVGLTSVEIPGSIASIGDHAFEGCSSLTSVTIPSSVTSIGDFAFAGCKALVDVDSNNSNYMSVDGVLYDKNQTVFIHCPTSKTSITLVQSVNRIGKGAFYDCKGLTSVIIPNSVLHIEEYAFADCIGLVSVTMPDSIISIKGYAFYNCNSLNTVTIPSTVTSIGWVAFSGCTSLTKIYARSTTPITISSNLIFPNVIKTTCALYVPSGSKERYQAAYIWKDFTNIMEMTTDVPQVRGREIKPSYNAATGTLQFTGLEDPAVVDIYDMQGRRMYSGICRDGACHVSTAGGNRLPAGVYVLKVTVGKETATMKVVM